jgi:hypothetical protein
MRDGAVSGWDDGDNGEGVVISIAAALGMTATPPRCRVHVDTTKRINLFMIPPILIVHLKHFEFCQNLGPWKKININRTMRYLLSN